LGKVVKFEENAANSGTEDDSFIEEKVNVKKKIHSANSSVSSANVSREDGTFLCSALGKDNLPCKSKSLNGFQYCWHHAPLDPESNFIFCQYKNSKRGSKTCNIPVAKNKKHPYCKYHIKSAGIVEDDETNESFNPRPSSNRVPRIKYNENDHLPEEPEIDSPDEEASEL